MITFKQKGDWSKTNTFLERILNLIRLGRFDYYGRLGMSALQKATPEDTGKTSKSWNYEIVRGKGRISIFWTNNNLDSNGTPIAVILQYGHATRNGGWVEGIDYINPAMQGVFEQIANDLWKEVAR